MSTTTTLLFALALPKRFNLTARIYRRAKRVYAYLMILKDRLMSMPITMEFGLSFVFAIMTGLCAFIILLFTSIGIFSLLNR